VDHDEVKRQVIFLAREGFLLPDYPECGNIFTSIAKLWLASVILAAKDLQIEAYFPTGINNGKS
jgi:hypothetical protein